MPITLGTNIASLQAERGLSQSSNRLSQVFERLSSGQRINRASDDAAGLAVASSLNAKSRVYTQGVRNLNDGISALSIADSAIDQLVQIVERQRELSEQAANGVLSDDQRAVLESEAEELSKEYQRILESTEYNGIRLLDGSAENLLLQNGFGQSGTISTDLRAELYTEETTFTGLGTYVNQDLDFGTGGLGIYGGTAEVLVTDINGDNRDDIFAVGIKDLGGTISANVALILGEEDGTYTVSDSVSFNLSTLAGVGSPAIRGEYIGTKLTVYVNQGLGGAAGGRGINVNSSTGTLFVSGTGTTATDNFSTSATGDFNGDGVGDLVSGRTGPVVRTRTQNTESSVTTSFGYADLTQSNFNISTVSGATAALDSLSTLSNTLLQSRAALGASLSRVETATRVGLATVENYREAESRIRDADIAEESANLVRLSILREASSAILAQANQQPALALQLLSQE